MLPGFIPLDWQLNGRYPRPEEHLNPLQNFISGASVDPVWRQIEENTPLGWQPASPTMGFELSADDYLIYPSVPPLAPAAMAWHLGEKVLVYPAGFVCVVQLNGDFTVARILL
jgi:hypothetical protein